jgi:hypothetical protein
MFPFLVLIALAVFEWRFHGGSLSSLRNLQYSLFH